MTCLFKPISEEQYLFNRLNMLSCLSVTLLAKRLGVEEQQVTLHPDFVTEAEKMIERITF